MLPENVQDFKHGGAILLNPFQGRADGTRGRRGRRSQFHLLVRKGEDRGGKLSRWHRDDGGMKARSCDILTTCACFAGVAPAATVAATLAELVEV